MQIIFTSTNASASTTDLEAFEKLIDSRLPDDYRNFLLSTNGGTPQNRDNLTCKAKWDDQPWASKLEDLSINYFYKLSPKTSDALELHNVYDALVTEEQRIPKNTIAIANDPGSNQFLISLNNRDFGSVYFWHMAYELNPDDNDEPDYSNVAHVAASFSEFLNCFSLTEF